MRPVNLFLAALSFASLCPLTVTARADDGTTPSARATVRDPELGADRRAADKKKPAPKPVNKPPGKADGKK